MAIFSTLRSRRFANKQQEVTQQMITFRLRREWFALPILTIQKVVLLGEVYGDPHKTGISITKYEDKEILVIDVGQRIFNNAPELELFSEKTESELSLSDLQQRRYLIILYSQKQDLIGLPIDSQPIMRYVTQSAFKALPENYLIQGNIQGVSSQIIDLPDHPPIFILETSQLI
ncbi:CheW domain protein [Stanieria cyanosphaera PCC 7437]|uniref:CheW domain protein n=1 Tax=Stanieria cyanosphaera (strain ATCC 29371 / PCC 7437) TaxID=111780 RepID=K9Y0H0_STAC7|nr:chemotaxis protein CheW [Stanieria cyanosphaera]AFZ37891.1 CheW domain protein [Stanieria cyanosphaera PCC 7437]